MILSFSCRSHFYPTTSVLLEPRGDPDREAGTQRPARLSDYSGGVQFLIHRRNARTVRGVRHDLVLGTEAGTQFFIGSLEVFFLQKALEPLVRIKPGFQRWEPIACGFSRGTPGEHEVLRRGRAAGASPRTR